MTAMWDGLWLGARLATMASRGAPYGAIADGAIAACDGRIAYVGARADLPGPPAALAAEVIDAGGRWITPGLIDCHTHMVFGGDRAREFERRLGGASYEEIARAGGGILATVRATRAADAPTLAATAARRLAMFLAEGVTTVEIKSGYGLDTATEMRMLRVARQLGQTLPVTIRTSFLGAHAIPPDYAGRRDDYVALICDEMLPAVAAAGLADAVDAFCERIAFTAQETELVFRAARHHRLPVKLHAEQLSDQGGAILAARYGALSADHLEYLSDEGVRALAASGTVAVLLPGAYYLLRETRLPPIAALRAHGVPIAIASDCNPGSAPVRSLRLMLSMACTSFGLTPEEALAGVTRNAARALGLAEDCGTLDVGKAADLALWDIDHPAELSYWVGGNPCASVVKGGKILP